MKQISKFVKRMCILSVALALASRGHAQTQSHTQTEMAKLNDPAQPSGNGAVSTATVSTAAASTDTPKATADRPVSLEVIEELDALKKRVEELETELKDKAAPGQPAPAAAAEPAVPSTASTPITLQPASPAASIPTPVLRQLPTLADVATSQGAAPEKQPEKQIDPFSLYDYTWMNGNSRNEDTPLATKYFSPEFRADSNFTLDNNHPIDHSLGGSTETFRSGELVLEQLSFGGDLRVGNVRGRVLTMFGMFATTTPRNDASFGVGQWDYRDAYRYVSEAWGGYHFGINNHGGLNVDAGIFVSYIGLFSYYNFDNWAYQPSYVSSNTPWFFNGLRIQWFPTAKLKIEPWIINGWQSYAKFNGHPGLGGQILWRPNGWLSIVSNNYGMGNDTLGNPGQSRIHTDNSIEVKYFDKKDNLGLDKMAFSLTADLGCQYGGRVGAPGGQVSCYHNRPNAPLDAFRGWMGYNRFWFHKDLFAMTLGGGTMTNPGRYLTLLQPINGADAVSGSPYFTENPGDPAKMWDTTVTLDYMPAQFITFRLETGYRHSSVPYWTGPGGITPPGAVNGSNGSPADYVCASGASSGIGSSGSIAADLPSVEAACGTPGSRSGVWFPDLRKDQMVETFAIMVKF